MKDALIGCLLGLNFYLVIRLMVQCPKTARWAAQDEIGKYRKFLISQNPKKVKKGHRY